MPPFSAGRVPVAGANGFMPHSIKLFWPSRPCQAWVFAHEGSTRAVEPGLPAPGLKEPVPVQSAVAQYLAPGIRRLVGRWAVGDSVVFASHFAMVEFPPPPWHVLAPGTLSALVQSTGPPASYTTCAPVCL